MFKKFLNEIIEAKDADELNSIFYREDGIDRMFQKEKITWKDHQTLLALISKMQGLMEKEN